jgi:uncharacterized membrane protein YgaE (UPF0421/DUF939 family)
MRNEVMASDPIRLGARFLLPFHWREAALGAPAMPLLIFAGIQTGHPVAGATAAGAAFAVGFGAARELRGRRWGAMAAATLGMSLAAFAGCLLGQNFVLFVLVAGIAAAGCAAALQDEDLWWVILQLVIAFLIAGYYAGPLGVAATRALVVLTGGTVQVGIIVLLAKLFPAAGAPTILRKPPHVSPGLRGAHMVRAAICVTASLLVTHGLGLSNSYWAPMTALIVLKPRLHETRARGFARLTGTLAGCALATAYAHVCGDSDWLLGSGTAVSAMAAYALQKANYVSLTTAITATVVLLLSLGHAPALANAEHRLVATLVGGAIALAVAWLVPHGRRFALADVDRVGT